MYVTGARIGVFVVGLVVLVASPAAALWDDGAGPPLIPGSRQVHIRNESGGLGVHTAIPDGSLFIRHGGGPAAECQGVAAGDDPDTLDVVEEVRPIRSTRWIFTEGLVAPDPFPPDLSLWDPDEASSLASRTRLFSVWCSDTFWSVNFLQFLDVPALDPMLDPRPRLTNLYNGLQLDELAVYENPVVGRWGGLVVRSPAWLAINGSAWRAQRSNVEYWRGWELYLIAQPVGLEFMVEFTPDPDRPSPAFSGVIPCVSSGDPTAASAAVEFPQRPSDLADFAEPGSNRACEWTPPGPGEVTVTARQTFAMTFWASGAVEAQPDYVWTSPPATFRVGELSVVNVNG